MSQQRAETERPQQHRQRNEHQKLRMFRLVAAENHAAKRGGSLSVMLDELAETVPSSFSVEDEVEANALSALIDSIDTQLKNPDLTDDEIDTLLDKRQKLLNKLNN